MNITQLPNSYPIVVLTTVCNGSETSLEQCKDWSTSTNPLLNLCDHSNDFYVYCHNDSGVEYRVVGDWSQPARSVFLYFNITTLLLCLLNI